MLAEAASEGYGSIQQIYYKIWTPEIPDLFSLSNPVCPRGQLISPRPYRRRVFEGKRAIGLDERKLV